MFNFLKLFTTIFLWLISLFCFAQSQTAYQRFSSKIDSLANIGLPKSALSEVEKLDDLARKNNNVPQQIKAVIYRMTFQSYLEENALEAIITRLKLDIEKSAYPVKPVLQSLLAEIYWKYYQENRYQFSQRTKLEKPDQDFTRWDLRTIIDEVSRLYNNSLTNAELEQRTPVNILDGVLTGDTQTRYLRPTLYDLLAHRALDFFLQEEPDILNPKMPFSLKSAALFGSNEEFINTPITTTDSLSISYQGIKLLRNITRFHSKNKESESLADINLKRLSYVYRKSVHPQKDTLYLKSLKKLVNVFKDNQISADALVEIGQYYKQKDSLRTAMFYLNQSCKAFSNSIGCLNATTYIKQIQQKEIGVTIEGVNIPSRPILVLLNYRNLNKIEYKLFKLSDKQLKDIAKLDERGNRWRNERIQPSDALLSYLGKLDGLTGATENVINPADYRSHTTEFKLDPLSAGNYLLLTSDAESKDNALTNLVEFKVSNLAYISRITPSADLEIRTLDRTMGKPLPNVTVTVKEAQYLSNVRNYVTIGTGTSDENGVLKLDDKNYNRKQTYVRLSVPGDAFQDDELYMYGALAQYTEEKEIQKTIFFTDRKIYRPGQTVYFKGLQLIQTGRKSRILVNKVINVKFNDANRKEISSLNLKINDFGTFAGSFIIPQLTLNGSFSIQTENGNIQIQIEEYKRPTFQVELDPLKGLYKLNDSVIVTGKVLAFSGYGLSQSNVAYRITRRKLGLFNYRYDYSNNEAVIASDTIITSNSGEFKIKFEAIPEDRTSQANQIYSFIVNVDVTDASGETRSSSSTVFIGDKTFQVNFSLPQKLSANGDNVKLGMSGSINQGNAPLYVIDGVIKNQDIRSISPEDIEKIEILKDASATAIYGSRAANGVILITTKGGGEKTTRDLKIPINLTNLNKQPLDGNVKVRVYSLQSPGNTFIKRLWNAPDIPTMPGPEFKKSFPFYEYKDEDNEKTWPKNKLVAELELKISADKNESLDFSFLKKQESGTYKVELLATNARGDTATLDAYTYLISEPSATGKLGNWVLPVKTSVIPGEEAEFIVGIGQESKILMEVYEGDKIHSSEWLYVGNKQKLIKVPVSLNSNHISVQFLTVFQNRVLALYQRIAIRKSKDELDVKFITFRDKLQPGAKEQWKLQISSKERQAAEMVATLYDASLDAMAGKQNWSWTFNDGEAYTPEYFAWNKNNFVKQISSIPFGYNYIDRAIIYRHYESLDYHGYNYWGGYNYGYRAYLRSVKEKASTDKNLEETYLKNAALIKDGFDIKGKVTDNNSQSLPGVSVKIKGTKIGTFTNSNGYFKLKVPKNATLVFSFIGFKPKELNVKEGKDVAVKLAEYGQALNEVVVTGYGGQKKEGRVGSTAMLYDELKGRAPGVVLQEASAQSDKKIMIRGQSSITEDNSVYNTAAVDGALQTQPKEITIRKNFSETAFFYPQLRTNGKGEILIEFTIPEALTRWHFKGFAHSKELKTGYIEKEVVTQKSLMVSANMPRFFREGDTIVVSARIANLTEKQLNGKVELQLFNAITMQPVNLFIEQNQGNQDFSVKSSSNKAVSFKIAIPSGLDAITYRLTADGGAFIDGEENSIPVLPNSMMVTESLPIMVRAGKTKTFTLDKLVNNASSTLRSKTLTLEFAQNPVWYAVQALPYLMEYPYECSEQVFSRYFANSMASTIIKRLPRLKMIFEQWKNMNSEQLLSNLEKNQELKSVLLEETPWLRNAASETEQKKRIALLFDFNKMTNEMELNLEKLSKMQRMDGGFPWFTGSKYSDRYITQHILAGMGQLTKLTDVKFSSSFNNISKKALGYLDNEIVEDYKDALAAEKKSESKSDNISSLTIHALYVRSYYAEQSMSSDLKAAFNYFLPKVSATWQFKSLHEQGLIAFIMQRYEKASIAKEIVRSLKESAQQSDELGMYWGKNQLGYYWYQSPVETQALLIELFSEIGTEQSSIEEMKIWLLRNKQTTNWKTTKATALACYSLLLRGDNWIEGSQNSEIKLDNKALSALKPEIKSDAGTGYIKISWKDEQILPAFGKVSVSNSGTVLSWGALHWQYLENLDKITSAETQLKLERKYFIQRQTDAGPRLVAADEFNTPKTGDMLKVVVYLNADRDYEYVHLKDMRPSGTEPSDVLSGYKYQERFYYYQVTKDVATNFFINYLPKGKYVFEYSLRVVQPGNYSTGISTIQCLYAPEFNAHSAGSRMVIK